jgi:hypothetical protein
MEELRTKVASQLAELGNKTNAISHLKLELAEKTAAIFALEVWDRALKDQRHATEEPVSSKPHTVHGMERPSPRRSGINASVHANWVSMRAYLSISRLSGSGSDGSISPLEPRTSSPPFWT